MARKEDGMLVLDQLSKLPLNREIVEDCLLVLHMEMLLHLLPQELEVELVHIVVVVMVEVFCTSKR